MCQLKVSLIMKISLKIQIIALSLFIFSLPSYASDNLSTVDAGPKKTTVKVLLESIEEVLAEPLNSDAWIKKVLSIKSVIDKDEKYKQETLHNLKYFNVEVKMHPNFHHLFGQIGFTLISDWTNVLYTNAEDQNADRSILYSEEDVGFSESNLEQAKSDLPTFTKMLQATIGEIDLSQPILYSITHTNNSRRKLPGEFETFIGTSPTSTKLPVQRSYYYTFFIQFQPSNFCLGPKRFIEHTRIVKLKQLLDLDIKSNMKRPQRLKRRQGLNWLQQKNLLVDYMALLKAEYILWIEHNREQARGIYHQLMSYKNINTNDAIGLNNSFTIQSIAALRYAELLCDQYAYFGLWLHTSKLEADIKKSKQILETWIKSNSEHKQPITQFFKFRLAMLCSGMYLKKLQNIKQMQSLLYSIPNSEKAGSGLYDPAFLRLAELKLGFYTTEDKKPTDLDIKVAKLLLEKALTGTPKEAGVQFRLCELVLRDPEATEITNNKELKEAFQILGDMNNWGTIYDFYNTTKLKDRTTKEKLNFYKVSASVTHPPCAATIALAKDYYKVGRYHDAFYLIFNSLHEGMISFRRYYLLARMHSNPRLKEFYDLASALSYYKQLLEVGMGARRLLPQLSKIFKSTNDIAINIETTKLIMGIFEQWKAREKEIESKSALEKEMAQFFQTVIFPCLVSRKEMATSKVAALEYEDLIQELITMTGYQIDSQEAPTPTITQPEPSESLEEVEEQTHAEIIKELTQELSTPAVVTESSGDILFTADDTLIDLVDRLKINNCLTFNEVIQLTTLIGGQVDEARCKIMIPGALEPFTYHNAHIRNKKKSKLTFKGYWAKWKSMVKEHSTVQEIWSAL